MKLFLEKLLTGLNWIGTFFPQLTVRALLAWEFWESGLEKYHGQDIRLDEVLTIEALETLDQSIADGKPFYLYMSHYAIHAPWAEFKL